MAKDSGANAELRPYVANMVYVGALTELLGIDADEIKAALVQPLQGQDRPDQPELRRRRGRHRLYTQNNRQARPLPRAASNKTAGKILIGGNEAGALGAVFGGVTVAAWYPITPSTSLVDALGDYAKELRVEQGDRRDAPTPSCRRRTRSPRSAWWSARAGRARAP